MPILSFRGSRDKAPRPLTVDDAAAVLAEREAHAAAARTELDAKRAAYNAAVGEASLAGPNLDTPEVERAHRELTRANDRHGRALEAVRFAENEHAAALAERTRLDTVARWDELERLAIVRTQAAKKFADLAGKLAAARDEFLRAARSARTALPARARSRPHFDVFTEQAAAGQVHAELQRIGLIPDPRRGLGVPPAKPLAEISAELCAMVKRAHNEAQRGEDAARQPETVDMRAMVRPVPSPEDVDREPERAT